MLEITKENFESEVLGSEKLVLIDFWASWCAPCRAMEPVIEEIASSNKDVVKIAKVNVDENPELTTELSVMNIPTLVFFKNGKEIQRITGYNTAEYIQKKINPLLKK